MASETLENLVWGDITGTNPGSIGCTGLGQYIPTGLEMYNSFGIPSIFGPQNPIFGPSFGVRLDIGKRIDIYDFPDFGGQLHLHENELGISGGRLYPYDRSDPESYKPINAYEGSMLDLYAKNLGISPKIIGKGE